MSKRIIVVTGASSGMGKEFVYQIIKKESVDEIWLIARRKERLDQLARNFYKEQSIKFRFII